VQPPLGGAPGQATGPGEAQLVRLGDPLEAGESARRGIPGRLCGEDPTWEADEKGSGG
jgi:hypothetical protein